MKPRTTAAKPAATEPSVVTEKAAAPNEKAHQRLQRRVPHRVPCRVRLVDPSTGDIRSVVGETVNLSPTGVALQVGMEVPVGTWVETLVPHVHGEPLFLCGTVVHVRRTLTSNFEIGVSMDDERPPTFS
jgi:hypothetical protein